MLCGPTSPCRHGIRCIILLHSDCLAVISAVGQALVPNFVEKMKSIKAAIDTNAQFACGIAQAFDMFSNSHEDDEHEHAELAEGEVCMV